MKKKWLLNNLISIFALILSLIVLFYTNQYNRETKLIAEKALMISQESNKIKQGAFNQFPIITINNNKEKNNLLTNNLQIYFHNESEIIIGGFEIKIYPLNNLIYETKSKYDSINNLERITHKIYFSQMLTKNGFGDINIAPLLIKIIFDSKDSFKNISNLHRGLFNILINPIRLGQKQSEDTLYYGGNNRILINIDFIPNEIFKLNLQKLIDDIETNINIYGGEK
jgi:hypothetical protein